MRVIPAIILSLATGAAAFSAPAISSFAAPVAKAEWSEPIAEGVTVLSVTFKTRVRIESEDENPFD